MAYESCPQCGTRKHQLVACPQCGFKRLNGRTSAPRLIAEPEEQPHPPKDKVTLAPPSSTNFENCPQCGQRKHLVMACPQCGFSRAHKSEKHMVKPPPELKKTAVPRSRIVINYLHDDNYYEPSYERNLIEEDSYFPMRARPRPKSSVKIERNPN